MASVRDRARCEQQNIFPRTCLCLLLWCGVCSVLRCAAVCCADVYAIAKHHVFLKDADGTPLVNKSKFPDLKAMVGYGHSKDVLMGWYENNCICMDSYTVASDPVWAEKTYIGDVAQILDAGFDGVKIDNCGDDQAKAFTSRLKHINASGKAILVENSNQGFGNPQRGQ